MFTVVDGAVALVILLSGVLAYSRGLVRETLSILGWVGAAVVAYVLTPMVKPLIEEVPIVSDFLNGSCELAVIASFAAVFAGALILISIFSPVFAGAVQRSALGGIDQGLGFLFGVIRGGLLVIVALIIYDQVLVGEPIALVEDSQSREIFANVADEISNRIPSEAPQWFIDRYEQLLEICTGSSVDAAPEVAPEPTPEVETEPAPAAPTEG